MNQRRRVGIVAAAIAATAALTLSACGGGGGGTQSGNAGGTDSGKKTFLTIPGQDTGTFTQNFNPFVTGVLPMTETAIYERMFIYSKTDEKTTPWLATEWETNEDATQAVFHLREGVKWSDGEPFVAQDVVTSFTLQKELRGGYDYLETITAVDDHTVQFDFNRPYAPALFELGGQIIVPDHIFAAEEDPGHFLNAEPVGTGPYTEVLQFSAQSYDLGPNPHYWQAEKQKIDGIRMLAFSSNDGANLALQNGDADWGPQFIPDVEQTFVAKNPEYNHYWFPAVSEMISWQFNTQVAPGNDPGFRKAMSMSIDREQISEIGMSGYTKPANCTGLSNAYVSWQDPAIADNCDWTVRDIDAANKLLDELGYTIGSDGYRTNPDGSPLQLSLMVGSASTDWLSVMNIIAQNLEDVHVKGVVDAPDWAAVNQAYEKGDFTSGIVWSPGDPTPFQYWRNTMSTELVVPVGEETFQNYHRYGNEEATELLAQWAASGDEAEQREINIKLQEIYNEEAPLIPLFTGPFWGAWSTERFVGWPDEDNPYSPVNISVPGTTLILTTLEPRS